MGTGPSRTAVAEPIDRRGAEDALERINQLLREAAVKFGLGQLSPGTYATLRKRLEEERARVEADLIEDRRD